MDTRVATCNNCGEPQHEIVYREGVAQKHQIVRCTSCGLMYAYPKCAANLEQYVASRERLSLETPSVVRSFDKLADYEPIGIELRGWLPRGGALLEVGCHAGVLLERFRAQGWRVSGVEPDPTAAAFARSQYRLDVKASTLEDAGYARASFDALVMLHVIEHLDDPAVQAIARVLRPGGILVLETPVYDTLLYRLLGRRERSLSCVGRTVSLGRLLWNLGVISKSKLLQRAIDRLNDAWDLIHRGRLYLNTGDMVRVYARKQRRL
jgi:2-polyprenyl-3-methyl-5-hydroxy-6-metoxy-1,4-benzoquinol methylase